LRPHKKRSERRGLLAQTLSGGEQKMLAIGPRTDDAAKDNDPG
jgi:hypothetical protein